VRPVRVHAGRHQRAAQAGRSREAAKPAAPAAAVAPWSRIALPIFVLAGFVKGIPSELDNAAAMDGCPYIQHVFQIVVPLLKPALSVVGLIVAIRVWNDIIGPVIFLPSGDIKPISAGLLQFFAENAAEWTLIAAAIAITASPLGLLYLFTQRYIIAGMTNGALKG
jgi:raffinose/stachyose/melibiose transport system permease protein